MTLDFESQVHPVEFITREFFSSQLGEDQPPLIRAVVSELLETTEQITPELEKRLDDIMKKGEVSGSLTPFARSTDDVDWRGQALALGAQGVLSHKVPGVAKIPAVL